MRKALNSNPVVQAAAVGVLVLVVGFMLVTRMGGSSAESPAPPATTDPAATATAPGAVPTTDATGAVPVDPGAVAPSDVAPPARAGFEAGPGLPEAVVEAYDAGKVVVLLIVRNSGIDDNKVKSIVQSLGGRSDLAVFTTRASGIADYSRIAQGADVSRVPALVVIRPKKLTDGPLPSATVSYGFRSEASVKQTVEDALYKGRTDLPYYPK